MKLKLVLERQIGECMVVRKASGLQSSRQDRIWTFELPEGWVEPDELKRRVKQDRRGLPRFSESGVRISLEAQWGSSKGLCFLRRETRSDNPFKNHFADVWLMDREQEWKLEDQLRSFCSI